MVARGAPRLRFGLWSFSGWPSVGLARKRCLHALRLWAMRRLFQTQIETIRTIESPKLEAAEFSMAEGTH